MMLPACSMSMLIFQLLSQCLPKLDLLSVHSLILKIFKNVSKYNEVFIFLFFNRVLCKFFVFKPVKELCERTKLWRWI